MTFNKVIEHVKDPVAMLAHAANFLQPEGTVYVEVPDGEAAAAIGAERGREEFTIDHLHAFSMASLCLLTVRAGFRVRRTWRVEEPSGN